MTNTPPFPPTLPVQRRNTPPLPVYDQDNLPQQLTGEDLDVLKVILLDEVSVSLRELNNRSKAEIFKGIVLERDVAATTVEQEISMIQPDHRCVAVSFINDGPDTVYVAINNKNHGWNTIRTGESPTVDFAKAEVGVERIYYYSDSTSSLRINAKY